MKHNSMFKRVNSCIINYNYILNHKNKHLHINKKNYFQIKTLETNYETKKYKFINKIIDISVINTLNHIV